MSFKSVLTAVSTLGQSVVAEGEYFGGNQVYKYLPLFNYCI